jgi:hypothetical protein
LVAFQDSDNRWLPHHLAMIHDVVARLPSAVLVSTSRGYTLGDGGAADAQLLDVAVPLLLDNIDVGFLSTVTAKRSALLDVGGFDETLRYAEDVDLYIRLALEGPFALLAATTVERGVTGESLEAAGRAAGLYSAFVARSADNALLAIHRRGAREEDVIFRAAMARQAIGAALTALEAGAGPDEVRVHLRDACHWVPAYTTDAGWITRQVDAAHRGRDASELLTQMHATVSQAWPALGAVG